MLFLNSSVQHNSMKRGVKIQILRSLTTLKAGVEDDMTFLGKSSVSWRGDHQFVHIPHQSILSPCFIICHKKKNKKNIYVFQQW